MRGMSRIFLIINVLAHITYSSRNARSKTILNLLLLFEPRLFIAFDCSLSLEREYLSSGCPFCMILLFFLLFSFTLNYSLSFFVLFFCCLNTSNNTCSEDQRSGKQVSQLVGQHGRPLLFSVFFFGSFPKDERTNERATTTALKEVTTACNPNSRKTSGVASQKVSLQTTQQCSP